MITKNRILFALGIWIVLVPLLGFPSAYKTFFVIASGLGVILLAFLYARSKRIRQIQSDHGRHEVVTDVYAENLPVQAKAERDDDDKYTDLRAIKDRSRAVKSF